MHPVFAKEAMQVIELDRRQRLAAAERQRLVAAGIAAEGGGVLPAATRRLGNLVLGLVTGMSLFRGTGSVSVRDESAAIRSA